jgi:hypothetical protein
MSVNILRRIGSLRQASGYAPTGDGVVGYDPTQERYVGGGGGLVGSFPRVLAAYRPNETLSAATTVNEQDFTQTYTLPAGYLIANKTVRVTATFIITSSITAPTARLKLRLGTTVLYDGAATTPGNSNSNTSVTLGVLLQGTGAAGPAVDVEGAYLAPSVSGWPLRPVIAQPVAVATNAPQAITLSIQYSATTAGNTLRLASLLIEELN